MAYKDNVLTLNPIAYWPLDDTSGTTADNHEGTASKDGTYVGSPTLDDEPGPFSEGNAPSFDGVNDAVGIATSQFDTDFDRELFSISFWVKSADWSTAGLENLVRIASDAGSNFVLVRKQAASTIRARYEAVNVAAFQFETAISGTSWQHIVLTVDIVGDEAKFYLNNSEVGSDTSIPPASGFTGTLSTDFSAIASEGSTTIDDPFTGNIMHVAVFDYVLSSTERGYLYDNSFPSSGGLVAPSIRHPKRNPNLRL